MNIRDKLLGSLVMWSPPGEGAGGANNDDPPADGGERTNDQPADGSSAPAAASGDGDPPADGGDPPADGGDPPPEPKPAVKPAKDWKDKEISRKHAQLQAAKRREQELERELEDTRALAERAKPPAPADGEPPPAPRSQQPAAPDPKAVQDEALKIVAVQDYNRSCDAAVAAGKDEYKEKWSEAFENLKLLGGFDGPDMVNILAADNPHQVLYKLGSEPDEFHRVMALPPAKRMAEFIKLGLPPPKAAVKAPSGAPDPVETLRGRGGDGSGAKNLYDDKLSDDDWHKKRDADRLAAWKRKHGQAA